MGLFNHFWQDLEYLFMELSQSTRRLRGVVMRGMRLRKSLGRVFVTHAVSLTKIDLSGPFLYIMYMIVIGLSFHLTECDDEVTDEMATEIAHCVNLAELQLEGCHRISPATLSLLVSSCLNLVVLALGGCQVTDRVLSDLLLPLDLSSSGSSLDARLKLALAERRQLRRALHTLLLGSCHKMTARSIPFINSSDHLRVLKLSRCNFVTPLAAHRIAFSLSSLRVLDLSECPKLPKKPYLGSPNVVNGSGEADTTGEGIANSNDQSAYALLWRQLSALLPSTIIKI